MTGELDEAVVLRALGEAQILKELIDAEDLSELARTLLKATARFD